MSEDAQGPGLVRKDTGWMTNSARRAERLAGVCSNKLVDPDKWHRHVHLINGRAKAAQKYPPALVKNILAGLKEELHDGGETCNMELGGPSLHEHMISVQGEKVANELEQ